MKSLYTHLNCFDASKIDVTKLIPEVAQRYEIKINEIEQIIHNAYEKNKFYQKAKNNEQLISESLDSLLKVNDGTRWFIPQKFNPEHNKDMDEMQQLIPKVNYLKTEGRLSCTTPFMYTIYGAVALSILSVIPSAFDNSTDFIPVLKGMASAGAVLGFAKGLAQRFANSYNDVISRREARYLDDKIKSINN